MYRLKVVGDENIPEEGPAVIVANHVSFADALIIMAGSMPIHFVMDHHIFRWPILSFVFRNSRAVPIAPARKTGDDGRAFDEVAAALEAGELVGLFPERRITDNGELYLPPRHSPYRRAYPGAGGAGGAARPVGQHLQPQGGPALSRPLRRGIFNRIELVSAPPLPPRGGDARTPPRGIVAGLRGEMR